MSGAATSSLKSTAVAGVASSAIFADPTIADLERQAEKSGRPSKLTGLLD